MAGQQRFPIRIEFWTSEEQADAIDRLKNVDMLGKADHLRRACAMYLQYLGANVAPRPAQPLNGHHQQEQTHGV